MYVTSREDTVCSSDSNTTLDVSNLLQKLTKTVPPSQWRLESWRPSFCRFGAQKRFVVNQQGHPVISRNDQAGR